jgi:hypothetical protein
VSIVATAQDGIAGLDSFVEVADRLLQREGLDDARVRFLRDWRPRRTGYTIHVYAGSTDLRAAEPHWAWASPHVETPEQLRDALESALRMRRLERRRVARGPRLPEVDR